MKGILTDLETDESRDVELDYEIVENDGRKVFKLIGGPTGYESFYVDPGYINFENMFKNGWTACVGTEGVYDRLSIPGEELKKVLEPILKEMQ